MCQSPNRVTILQDRALMLSKARSFFAERNMIEVDCPLLTQGASIDAHIDLIPAFYSSFSSSKTRFLHSSPEYGMKRLLSEGMPDIYQLAHVFRDNELSHKHNPEFMMAEWYRLNYSLSELIDETKQFCCLFLGELPLSVITYREAFQKYARIDYVKLTESELLNHMKKESIPIYKGIELEGKDALLNIILGTIIEPCLGKDGLTALTYYPASQAALACKMTRDDEEIAERFEIYYKGMELANGYHELGNSKEQHQRLLESNAMRKKLGKDELPIDRLFLKALEKGLPDCCGVAVGFDRLMMLRHDVSEIDKVLPFSWEKA